MNMHAAILGLPNTGKTTLFNILTNTSSPVANWAGVTVEAKSSEGRYCPKISWVDLPGVQTLQFKNITMLPADAQVAHDYLRQSTPDIIVNVVDVRYLIRDFYLTSQLAELNIPMVVVINFADNFQYLNEIKDWVKQFFGLEAVVANVKNKTWVDDLHTMIEKNTLADISGILQAYSQAGLQNLPSNKLELQQCSGWVSGGVVDDALNLQAANIRYTLFESILRAWKQCNSPSSGKLDAWLLHPWLGGVFFILIMTVFFMLSAGLGGASQEYISNLGVWVVNDLLIKRQGIIGCIFIAVMMCVSFWPVLCITYFLQSLLSESGYIPRMVFVVDRWFRAWQLSGQSFIPLLLGFGCNVPAIMATRSLSYRIDRLVTALMIPFIACSARLNLFILFSLAFFPEHPVFMVMGLYLLSIVVAGSVGLVAGACLASKEVKPLIQQLPPFQLPNPLGILKRSVFKSNRFVWRMSKTVIPLLLCMQLLSHVPWSENITVIEGVGRLMLPLFFPIGLTAHAWPLMVALVAGLIAKEAMLGALLGMLVLGMGSSDPSVWLSTPEASSLSMNLANTIGHFFKDTKAVFAFLVFVLLYVPCVATLIAFSSEFGKVWAMRSFVLSLSLGYFIAFAVYQLSIYYVFGLLALVPALMVGRKAFKPGGWFVYSGS